MVDDSEILEAVSESPHFVVTASDLSDEIPMTRQALGARMRDLCDEGRLRRRKVGGNAVVYYLPEWEQRLEESIQNAPLSV